MSQPELSGRGYELLWWYRHESDPDQGRRDLWQMASGCANETEARAEIARMRTQGYVVQRVVMHLVCTVCQGNARIAKRRKNARKDSKGNYAVYYVDCKACQGDGFTDAAEITL